MLHVFSATDTNLPTVNYEMPLKFVSALQSSLIILISSCSKHVLSNKARKSHTALQYLPSRKRMDSKH